MTRSIKRVSVVVELADGKLGAVALPGHAMNALIDYAAALSDGVLKVVPLSADYKFEPIEPPKADAAP